MTDVFAIQDEIAKAIAARLKVSLGDGERAPLVAPATGNLDAYHLYLRGRHYLAQRGLVLKRALECFDQALALDANYALAHAGVAEACTVLAQYGLVPPAAVLAKAHAAAGRALELAPDLAEAHCAAGALRLVCDWDWSGAATALHRALELNPRYVTARVWLAFYLVFVEGQFDEGVGQAQRAVDLDPLAPLPATQLGMTLLGAGRYEEAVTALQRAGELAPPTMFLPSTHLGLLYSDMGRTSEAMTSLQFAVASSGRHPWTLCALAVCCRSLGKLDDVEAIHDELVARARREYVQSTMLAVLAAARGSMDEAFALMERAWQEHDGILYLSKRYPFFRLLQSDPRMEQIFRRMDFPAAPAVVR